jgi:long-subunit acyl-CoA synthetase (AMP-forming)
VAVEDMPEYDPTGEVPCGEVVIRGPNVSPGYYRDAEKTYVFSFIALCIAH